MTIQAEIKDLFRLAADEAATLVALSGREPADVPALSIPGFHRLRGRLDTLPIPKDFFALLSNMVADAESLIDRSELGAARWQLTQTMRRLRQYETDWDCETGTKYPRVHQFGASRPSVYSNHS